MEKTDDLIEEYVLNIDKSIFSDFANIISELEDSGFNFEILIKDFINDNLEMCYQLNNEWKTIVTK